MGLTLLFIAYVRSRHKVFNALPGNHFTPGENPALDGIGNSTENGGYTYFAGGYVTPDGNVIYTGQAETLPWYLTWGAGWLF